MKKGPVIWARLVTKVEELPDQGMKVTFVINDPISDERYEVDLVLPAEGVSAIRNHILNGVS